MVLGAVKKPRQTVVMQFKTVYLDGNGVMAGFVVVTAGI